MLVFVILNQNQLATIFIVENFHCWNTLWKWFASGTSLCLQGCHGL